MKEYLKILILSAIFIIIPSHLLAAPLPSANVNIGISSSNNPQDLAVTLQVMALLTILSIAPAILVMTTAFVRIVVVLSFLRNALSIQNAPPSQVIIGLSLFLTFYIMAPYWGEANQNGLQPYLNGEISQTEALSNVAAPLREFMFKQTREADIALFVNLSQAERPETQEDVSTFTLIPAFIISELKTAFQIGFMIYIPFIVIDMIVASTLMSMGMMMLPPTMISLPFKVLLFVMVDGWHLLINSLIVSFK
ncbi:flagellar type III secretion system pore protein FliP [Pectinatus haikarae]|uniref:flagellar type III secretion system pore protein FliP n=1 Tax=Pectinatus haikarae TaxID=349096 RepID=UPI0035210F2E